MIKKCLICEKEFKVKLSDIKRGGGKYCSKKCGGVVKSKNMKGKNNPMFNKRGSLSPMWKGGEVAKNCLICNNKFMTRQYDIKIGKGKFCSRKCYEKWYSENKKGVNNHLWKGGITPLTKKIRHCLEYKTWHQSIFERDSYMCQICKQKGGDLHVNHKKLFSNILKDNHIKTIEDALICQELWSINNGSTLCIDCHYLITFGKPKPQNSKWGKGYIRENLCQF